MNNNYLEKLEFNKIKEILSTFSCTYIGKEYCANLFPTNIKEDVKYSLKETQEAVNLISRNSCPSFYEIADISINLKNLESGIIRIGASTTVFIRTNNYTKTCQ